MGEQRQPARQAQVATIFAIGLFQGLALVVFPAASSVLTSPEGYGLSPTQYGLLFLPQVVTAIAGALAVPSLSRRVPLKALLLAGMALDLAAMALLLASTTSEGSGTGFALLLGATACLGAGFGVTLTCLSTFAGELFPGREAVALTALNVMLGLGTALSPLLVAFFTDVGEWWWLPVVVAAGLAVLLVAAAVQPLRSRAPSAAAGRLPRLFWLFAAVLVLYGIAETMFGNWGTTLLRAGGDGAGTANLALASFWAAVTLGRLAIALSGRRVPGTRVYVALPWAVAAVLAMVALVGEDASGVLLFGAAGLACSGIFPMTVGYAEATFPAAVTLAAGLSIAAYQVGYGLAAFGGGALQQVASLPALFGLAAGTSVVMALLAVPVARLQTPAGARAS